MVQFKYAFAMREGYIINDLSYIDVTIISFYIYTHMSTATIIDYDFFEILNVCIYKWKIYTDYLHH